MDKKLLPEAKGDITKDLVDIIQHIEHYAAESNMSDEKTSKTTKKGKDNGHNGRRCSNIKWKNNGKLFGRKDLKGGQGGQDRRDWGYNNRNNSGRRDCDNSGGCGGQWYHQYHSQYQSNQQRSQSHFQQPMQQKMSQPYSVPSKQVQMYHMDSYTNQFGNGNGDKWGSQKQQWSWSTIPCLQSFLMNYDALDTTGNSNSYFHSQQGGDMRDQSATSNLRDQNRGEAFM